MKLFDTTEDLQLFLPIGQFTIENMQDDLAYAYLKYIAPYLPDEQMETSMESEEEEDKELVMRVKRANANLGYMLYFASSKVDISDLGITYSGSGENSKQASKEDKEDLYKSIRGKGYWALDSVLEYLFQNHAKFTIWKESDQYNRVNGLLIRKTSEFKLSKSMFILIEMNSYLEDVEIEMIDNQFDQDIITKLRTDLKANNLDEKQKVLLEKYLRPGIANLATAYAASANAIGRDPMGNITIYDDDYEFSRSRREVEKAKITSWIAQLKTTSEKRFALASKYIEANFEDLGGTVVENQNKITRFINDQSWGTSFH
jgi:hypothetical protein